VTSLLRVIEGGAVLLEPVTGRSVGVPGRVCRRVRRLVAGPWVQPVTVENDIGLLERTLTALGRPAWDVTPEDIDRVVGDLALAGRAASTRREYVQIQCLAACRG
jgi:integrase/recombinase XerD